MENSSYNIKYLRLYLVYIIYLIFSNSIEGFYSPSFDMSINICITKTIVPKKNEV